MDENGNNSVYHRAKTLASIFPWLLFVTLLPPTTSVRGVVVVGGGGGGDDRGPAAAAAAVVPGRHPPSSSSSPFPVDRPSSMSRRRARRVADDDRRAEADDYAPLEPRQQQQQQQRQRQRQRQRQQQRQRHLRHRRHRNDGRNRRRNNVPQETKVQNYCGTTWGDANSSCSRPCPDGIAEGVCDYGEMCFSDLTSCPSMTVVSQGGELGGGWQALPLLSADDSPIVVASTADVDVSAGGVSATATASTTEEIAIGTQPSSPDVAVAFSASSSSSSSPPPPPPYQNGAVIPPECPPSTTNVVNVGYYQSWARYRDPSCNPQTPSQIPYAEFGYTHLIYGFADISPETGEIRPYGGVEDEVGLYGEFNSLKSPGGDDGGGGGGLVTSIAVGGWNMDQSLFATASSTPESRTTFANSVVRFLTTYGFDGVDLDWEYPVTREGTADDYANYPLLVEAVRGALDAETSSSGRAYLITLAIPVSPDKLDAGYDLEALSAHVDWFHLMSYDVHGSWDEVAGSNTDMEDISYAVENHILSRGVAGEKLVFGMAGYGRSMRLTNPDTCVTSGCPIDGPGVTGCSGEDGFSPYFELRETYVDTGDYVSLLLNERTGSMEMILNGGDVYVSFDLEDTFVLKRDYYLSKCFRGQMWWAADMIKVPPFGPAQSQASQPPLLPAQEAGAVVSAVVVPSAPAPPVAAPGVTQDDAYCADTPGPELVPTKDCLGFVFCQNSRMSGSTTLCSPGLLFDANMGICNWPSETNLCGFEFCEEGMSGYVSFEECTKFYYCKAGKIDGDIDVCPDGTLFNVAVGICDWATTVVCDTKAPTPPPIMLAVVTPPPVPVPVQGQAPGGPANTPRPTYGKVGEGASTIVSASSPAYQAARLRFTPTDDAYVQEGMPYANYNDDYVVVDQDARYDGLLRFYVQGLEDRNVEYVKLRLYVSNQSTMGGKFFKCREDWHEDVVTWDSVPSIIDDKPIAIIKAALLDEWVEIDVSGLVQEDGPVSLRIISDSSDNVMYSSKENANGNSPELIVGVEPADPSSATLDDSKDSLPTVKNTFKIGPSDDAFVFRTTDNMNYGQDVDLKVDMDEGYTKSYLRFDLSRVHIDAVSSAKLRLYATLSSPSGGMFITVTDSDWNEGTITYNNAPPADGIPLGMLDNVEAGKWYELDLTDTITKSELLTICILGNHKDKVMYSSKDGPHSPEIVLTLEESVPLASRGGRVIELIPTDDASIALQTPNLNFGKSDDLRTDTTVGMHNFLLRFDATNVPRGQVKSAILRLYSMNVEPAFGGTFVENRSAQWDELTVTWKNAPVSDGRVMGSLMEVEYGSWYDMDVTSAVIGGSAVSFRVSSPHSNPAIYGSKESDNKPQLVIQYSPPDPLPDGFDLYIPTDDTSILMERPDQNFGRIEELKVDGYGGVYNSLLRFDLSSVEKGTVEQAILRLYAVDGSPSGGTFVATIDADWTQHHVTWSTAPAADGEILGTLGEVAPYQWYEIDLAKIVKDLGGESLSIRIAPSHGLRCAYSSSRDRLGHLPQLLIKADLFAGMG